MSKFLSQVGRLSARFRWVVISVWLLIFATMIALFAVGEGSLGDDVSMPETPATRALERMGEEFPESAGAQAATLQLVFVPDSGDVTDPSTAAQIADVLKEAKFLRGVETLSNPLDPQQPYISPDREVAVSTLSYGPELSDEQQIEYFDAAVSFQEAAPAALGVELGGNLVPLGAPEPGLGEGVGVLVAPVVLALTFGSLLTAGANLLIAALGVGIGLVGILAYGAHFTLGENSIILATMLGLAVGIDYNLFIISRFRNELRSGRSVDDAIARAAGTSGTAVVFAGLTVIVALVALVVANISFITEMGVAAGLGVLVAVLLALTLLPATLRWLGFRALSKKQRAALARGELWVEGQEQKRGLMRAWGEVVVKKPIISLLVGVLILVTIAVPMLSMKTAFSVPGGADPSTTERAAYNIIVDKFGGVQSPLIVTAEGENIERAIPELHDKLAALTGAQQVLPAQVNKAGNFAQVVVIPEGSPIDPATKDMVHDIRANAESISGVQLEVTGETAIGIDQDAELMQALVKYVIVIVVISLILLVVLFRSLLIPLIATLGYLLSVCAAFGASVAVFQWGWLDAVIAAPQGDPMLSLLPILLVGVLFGLAMDYQVFLVSRIQEMYRKGMSPKDAVREGFARSGPVLVAAASIMIVVFAGFATSTFTIGASIAFGLMVGVAADAFIVRLVLMPAALSLLGKSAWWIPAWLDRILPTIDVEGHSLGGEAAETDELQPILNP